VQPSLCSSTFCQLSHANMHACLYLTGSGGSLGDLVRRQMVRPYKPLYRWGPLWREATVPT
jgi:hypothetical protein